MDVVPESLRVHDWQRAQRESLAGSGARVRRCDGILASGCTLIAVANTRRDEVVSGQSAHDAEHDAGGAHGNCAGDFDAEESARSMGHGGFLI